MKTIGLKNLENVNVKKFSIKSKLKLRRFLFPFTRLIIRCNTKLTSGKKVVVDQKPVLDKKEQYIFASTHHFTEDIEAAVGSLDRNAWILIGTTDQIENNFKMYGAWLNGMIYVDRKDKKSRNDSVEKMKHILNNGSSILIFPEGGWNNKENDIVLNPFAGPFYLATECSKKVVPVASYPCEKDGKIHVKYGNPIDLSLYKPKETDTDFLKKIKKHTAATILKDNMATLMYELISEYSTPIKRSELKGDIHLQHCDNRIREYMRNTWSGKEEIADEFTEYKPKIKVNPEEVDPRIENTNKYEKVLDEELNTLLINNIINETEKDKLFTKLKVVKDPYSAFKYLGFLNNDVYKEKILNILYNLESSDVETFFQDYNPKHIVYEEDVWNFLDKVDVNSRNASVLSGSLVEREKRKIEESKYNLKNYLYENYDSIKEEQKNKKKIKNK